MNSITRYFVPQAWAACLLALAIVACSFGCLQQPPPQAAGDQSQARILVFIPGPGAVTPPAAPGRWTDHADVEKRVVAAIVADYAPWWRADPTLETWPSDSHSGSWLGFVSRDPRARHLVFPAELDAYVAARYGRPDPYAVLQGVEAGARAASGVLGLVSRVLELVGEDDAAEAAEAGALAAAGVSVTANAIGTIDLAAEEDPDALRELATVIEFFEVAKELEAESVQEEDAVATPEAVRAAPTSAWLRMRLARP